MLEAEVAGTIERFSPRTVSPAAACFARQVVASAAPSSPARAKALLFAGCRLAAFAEKLGAALLAETLLHPSMIERFVSSAGPEMAPATRRTLRSNLRHLQRAARGGPVPLALPRERSKLAYTDAEIAGYLALADAQPTVGRQQRLSALVCLSAGAGLVGADLRELRGSDIFERSGGVVVAVGGRRPRTVPVRAGFAERLKTVAADRRDRLVVGGTELCRHNVTAGLVASVAGGADLPRLEVGRLRATWLVAVAEAIGLKAFMDAAGITCSQRLGDLVATLPAVDEETAVALLAGGARR